jgi:hypothetical protein
MKLVTSGTYGAQDNCKTQCGHDRGHRRCAPNCTETISYLFSYWDIESELCGKGVWVVAILMAVVESMVASNSTSIGYCSSLKPRGNILLRIYALQTHKIGPCLLNSPSSQTNMHDAKAT